MPKTLTSSGRPLMGLIQEHIGTHGNIYFVNDNTSIPTGFKQGTDDPSHGETMELPWASLNYAFQRLQALDGGRDNYGDVIVVGEGHTEVVTAAAGLDCDVAGVTVIFAGRGNARGSIAFSTAVGADMDIDAADITFVNPRFIASIDALTGPIDVNAARFKILSRLGEMAQWADGTTINTTDCLVADANADGMVIDGFEFVDGDAAGAQKQSFIQVAGATGVKIKGVKCTGDFGTGIIENGTAWIDALVEDCVLDNASTSPTVCLALAATATGWVRNCSFRVASGNPPVTYSGTNTMQFHNVGEVSVDDTAAGANAVGTVSDTAATGAVTTTDTVMAYMKQLVTQNGIELDTNTLGAILYGTGGIATFPAAAHPADAVSLAEALRSTWARNIAGINPLGTVVFVAASGGSDAAAGTSPNAPKATIASAITAAGAGGTVVLGPGTHNVDVSVAALTPLANQQFVSAIPSFGGAPRSVIANDADDGANIVLVDVDGTVWRDIEFRNVTAATVCVTQLSIAQTTAVRGIHFENCWFNQNGMDGAMISLAMNDATNAITGSVFKNCRFTGGTGTTSVPVYIQVGVGGIAGGLIENCVFELSNADGDTTAIDFLDPGAGGTSSYALTIRNNDFIGPIDGGNDAEAITVAAAMTRDEIIPMIRNNYFAQTSASATVITNDKFNESVINNYVGDSSTGGTLLDPGT